MGFQRPGTCVINPPDAKALKYIKDKLQEDEDKLEHQMELLNKWLESNSHFPKNYDRNKVMNFLRACKYDMEKCKKKLEQQFYVRQEYTQVFSNLHPKRSEIANLPVNGNALFLPNLTPTGERIYLLGIHNIDADKMDLMAFVKYSYMCYDFALRQPFPVTGDVMILNGAGFTMKHFLKCVNTAVKDSIVIAYRGYLVRLKAIYIVNAPASIDKMVLVWKMFLTEKIRNRVQVSKTCDIVQNVFPKHCLPEEFGGTLPKINDLMKNWYKCLLENADWFQDQESCKCAEPPNNEKIEYYDEYGVEGSFRKLNID